MGAVRPVGRALVFRPADPERTATWQAVPVIAVAAVPAIALAAVAAAACLEPYGGGAIPPPPTEAPARRPAVLAAEPAAPDEEPPPAPRAARTIALRLLADPRVRTDPQWRDRARAAVARAATFFQSLAIRPEVVDVADWEPAPGADLEALLERLEQQPKGAAEVVVGLVGGEPLAPGPVEKAGKARYVVGDAVVVRWDSPDRLGIVLAHEIAHLLGGVHVGASGSVMRESLDPDARRIDPANEAVIDAARNRRFDRDRPPLDAVEARRVLRAIERIVRDDRHNRDAEDARTDLIEYLRTVEAEAHGQEGPRGEAARLVAAGRAERVRGAHGRALAYFREAARLCGKCPGAHLEIGRDLLERGRLDDALAELLEETRIDPKNADAFFLVGLAHEAAGREAQARDAFETVQRLDPAHAGAKQKLGR